MSVKNQTNIKNYDYIFKGANKMSTETNSMKTMKIDFFKKIKEKDKLDYMKHMISYFVSPIITGIKPASTISLSPTKDIYETWKSHGESFMKELRLEHMVLKDTVETAIVLIYDRLLLEKHLRIEKNRNFLCSMGYDDQLGIDGCLSCLKNKFSQLEFPNESGIFLGIPIEEVLGFIDKKDYILSGYFKVYDNSDRAEKVFQLYDNSKRAVMASTLKENGIESVIRKINHIYINQLDTVVNC